MEIMIGKEGRLWVHNQNQLENIAIGWIPEEENEDLVCINWDHVNQWRELLQMRDGVNNQNHQEDVVLLTSEQE